MTVTQVQQVSVDGLTLAFRQRGCGEPVLLLHGWPTSSYMWREVMVPIAEHHHVLALDLPGFGASDKPLGTRYDFDFFEHALEGFLDEVGVDKVGLAGHDIGGPIAVHWALRHPERVTRVALLNTLLYPQFSPSVLEFVRTATTPGQREQLTSRDGLTQVMRSGHADPESLTDELLEAVISPFRGDEDRRALAAAGIGLSASGFVEIERGLPSMRSLVGMVYGVRDRILPDIAATATRLKTDVPHVKVIQMTGCGHFVPEEAPQQVGVLLAEMLAQ